MESFGFGKQQNLETSSTTYTAGPTPGHSSSLKKRGGKGNSNQSNQTILSGLYRVYFKTDDVTQGGQ